MKVHIRQRKQSKAGSISLFLEIYKGTTTTPEGKVKNLRDYEYLNLYLIDKPKTPIEPVIVVGLAKIVVAGAAM